MTISSFLIRPPHSPDELTDHIKGYIEVAQSFSPDPLPEDTANRLLRRLITLPGYRQEQVRSAYRNDEHLGGYRIYERMLRVGAARLATGCIGGVYTRADARNQGVATALMHDAIAYAQAHEYPLLLLDGIPKFYHRYGYCDVYDLSTLELDRQAILALPETIDAYGRALDDCLSFCRTVDQSPEAASREHIARYVQALATRPNPHGQRILHIHSGAGLSNATMQQRLTVVRLFYDYLVEKGLCVINPVGRGTYAAGKGFGGVRDRALLAHFYRLPWIPTDDQWQAILQALQEEPLRNRVMLLLAYDGALRREELVSLQTTDIDPSFRQLTIRAEVTKNRRSRVVFYSEHTDGLLAAYLQHRRTLGSKRGPLFLSESRRNRGEGLSSVMWSKIVQQLGERAGVLQFTTHTPRHLRLTHMARAGMDLHKIATYAGHQSTQTTMLYIHLSGQDLAASIAQGMAGIDAWLARVMESEEV